MNEAMMPIFNRTETLTCMDMSLRALVFSVARYIIERRGGLVQTNPLTFELGCSGIPLSEQDACREEVEALYSCLEKTTVFDLFNLAQNISLS